MSEIDKTTTREMVMAVRDILNVAATVAGRGAQVHDGREEVFVFTAAVNAILEFKDSHPAMEALRNLRLTEECP